MRYGGSLVRGVVPLIVVLVLLAPALQVLTTFIEIIAPYVVGAALLFLIVRFVMARLNQW